MKSKTNELVKHALITFLIALVIYVVSFTWIQHRREFKGPWEVIFLSDSQGTPYLLVNQPMLQITNQRISFADQKIPQKNLAHSIHYVGPNTNASFGEVVFQDPTFLPGTITFNFWGHGVELMPRTMVIDQTEVPWNSQTNIVLKGPGKFERRPVKKPLFL